MYAFRTDGEKYDDKIGCPVLLLLTLLIVLPSSSGYIDCRISCRRCHENTEHPSVLEVYCAMCEECKQRRRERMQGRSTSTRTTMEIVTPLVRMRDGTDDSSEGLVKSATTTAPQPPPPVVQYTVSQHSQPQPPPPHAPAPSRPAQREAYEPALIGWPNGCPTPPSCSDSEEDQERLVYPSLPPTTTTTTTTPVPTTPCPPVPVCKKKKRKERAMMPMMPCMPCMSMCPCPMYTYPVPQNLMMPVTTTAPSSHIDYHYVYIGLPKNALTS